MRIYKKIIAIEFYHSFYDDNLIKASDIEIKPTPATEFIFSNYRLNLKQVGNSLQIIQECEKDDDNITPVIEIEKELQYNFIIKQKNKNFINFTDIPYPRMRQDILYFTNKKKNKVEKKGFLSKDKNVSDKDMLEIVGDKKYTFIQIKSKASTGIIGYIEFFTNGNYLKNIQNETIDTYSVNFNARPTFWQYHIVEKYNSVKNVKITDEHEKIHFIEDKQSNNKKEKIFTTKEKISLKDIYKHIFKLTTVNGNKNFSKILYEKLPFPKVASITKHETIQNEFISNTYLYI